MLFFNLEVLKGKSTKFVWIIAHLKLSKTMYDFGTIFYKNKQKLQLIWTYENMIKFEPFKGP
jgi:uncharacterized protein YlbG (UPF0298 family)